MMIDGTRAAESGGAEALSQPDDVRAQWMECMDDSSGMPYYYNVLTVRLILEE